MNRRHLAIFSKVGFEEIISGRKTVETRFSKHKISPFGEVSAGDIVYMKVAGGEIAGQFLVKKVLFFEGLDKKDWEFIKSGYGKALSLGSEEEDNRFFKQKEDARFGTIIFIDRVEQFITSPIKFTKSDRRAWVVMD